MATPLDEFANSPRRFRNNDGSEVVSSSLTKLGPGLIASRPVAQQPGETTYATLDVSPVVISALEARVLALEAGGRWNVPAPIIAVNGAGATSSNLALGSFQRTNLNDAGTGDVTTLVLPLVATNNVGRRVGVAEISDNVLAPGGPEILIETTGGQEIDINRGLPISVVGVRPRLSFVAVELSPGSYGWAVENYEVDP